LFLHHRAARVGETITGGAAFSPSREQSAAPVALRVGEKCSSIPVLAWYPQGARSLPRRSQPAPRYALGMQYCGFELPVDLINLTGAGPETFKLISMSHMAMLAEYTPILPHHNVLEIGSGIGRDAIPLTRLLGNGTYLGIDIIKRSIDWCTENITKAHPNFTFWHFDAQDQLHNPEGLAKAHDMVIPLGNGCVDRVIGQSVFTHMDRALVSFYLRELQRVLRAGGMAMLTCFIVDELIRSICKENLARTPYRLEFAHPFGNGCFINDVQHPMGAVAYTMDAIYSMVREAGFFDLRIVHGSWSGTFPGAGNGQDVLVLQAH
jgi:SAM-dependent methyltransferase